MESRQPIATPPADVGLTRAPRPRAWLGRIVLPGAFALLLVALSGTVAAASEPIGSLVDGASAPLVEPLAPVVEPVVELAGGAVVPILDPITPDAPVLPTLPIAPILPVPPPVLPALPILDAPMDLAIPGSSETAAAQPLTSVSPAVVVRTHDPIVERSAIDVVAGSVATIADDLTDAGAAVVREVVQSVEAVIAGTGLTTDAPTSVMAGMLIGLSMAMAAGWSAIAGQVRLRPIGLQLAPPVPPG